MPAWVVNSIRKRAVVVPSGGNTTVDTDSDPAAVSEIALADGQVSYLNIERLDNGLVVKVYRYVGSRGAMLRGAGTDEYPNTPYTTMGSAGVYEITWPTTLGAGTRTRVSVNSPATAYGEVIFEYDDVYRIFGGR